MITYKLANFDNTLSLISAEKKDKIAIQKELQQIFETRINKDLNYESITKLQNAIYADFLQSKDRSLIDILLEKQISPLTKEEIDRIANNEDSKKSSTECIMRGIWQSKNRKKYHEYIFCQTAKTLKHLSLADINPKIRKNILALTAKHAVINREIYHWTNIENLKNIIRNKAILGNEVLKEKGILFKGNVLSIGDIKMGDGKVICFAPYFIDYLAFIEKNNPKSFDLPENKLLRKGLVRLSIDASNLSPQQINGRYNQFLKLYDFFAPSFVQDIKISQDLSIRCKKVARSLQQLHIVFTFKGVEYETFLTKDKAICYGNLYTLNRFCLYTIFKLMIDAHGTGVPVKFYDVFINYLQNLSDNEIQRIFTVMGQAITNFAEYDFNTNLSLNNRLITEIYFRDTNKVLKLGGNLSDEQYEQALQDIVLNNIDNAVSTNQAPLVDFNPANFSVTLYGHPFQIGDKTIHSMESKNDVSSTPAEMFGSENYIETRSLPIKM